MLRSRHVLTPKPRDINNAETSTQLNVSFVFGPIAQLVEQRTHNPLVPGSSPGGPTSLRWK